MTLAAGTRLGAYEITGAIGAGGMGEVYRARDAKQGPIPISAHEAVTWVTVCALFF
jgi:hypothetical protein